MPMSNTPALSITAKPKIFRGHRVARSLRGIAQLSNSTKLGNVIDKPKYTPFRPQKKCTLKIFFESTDDLVDFQRRTIFKAHLQEVIKHCKNETVETVSL
jgi:hypothetical protein